MKKRWINLTRKVRAGVIGSGNIGSDLMMKLLRNDKIKITHMIGIDAESRGMKLAAENGLEVIANGIDGLKDSKVKPEILFDATSAGAHKHNNEVAQELGILMLDLTPAAMGPYTSPTVNMTEHLDKTNVNLITCGGQATTPFVNAVGSVAPVAYGEIVATVSSASAGPGTRANIDEFTETTSKAIVEVGGAKEGKAIMILNPAEPPIIMRDTVYCIVEGDTVDEEAITKAIREREAEVQTYVPGLHLTQDPIFDGNQVTISIEVLGAGDYLPVYAGNLDIMTASSVKIAEAFVDQMLAKTEQA